MQGTFNQDDLLRLILSLLKILGIERDVLAKLEKKLKK